MQQEADWKGFRQLFQKLRDRIIMNTKNGKETQVFFYYAGHGALLNGNTWAILNQPKDSLQSRFSLEENLRILGTMPKTFVLGLLDCSRLELPEGIGPT